jgi:hypothetical protein
MKDQLRIVDFSVIDGFSAPASQVDHGYEMTYKMARQHAADCKSELQRLELQLNALLSITGQNDLFEQAARMKPYEVSMGGAISALYAAKRNLAMLKDGGFGGKHPKVLAAQGQVKMLSEQLAMSVEDFKSTLRFKIKIAKDSLALIEESTKKDQGGWMGDRTKYPEYLTAKKGCEQQSTILKEMQESFLGLHVDRGCLLTMNLLQYLELAKHGQKVARPNTPMLLAVGASVVWVLGITLAYLREFIRPSNSK